MTTLRVAMASYYLPSESKIGAGHQAHHLAQQLTAIGHEVTMFSPCERPVDAKYMHRHMPLVGRYRTFRWAKALHAVDLSAFDIFHAHGDDYYLSRRRTPGHIRTLHGSCLAEALHIRGPKERLRMLLLGVSEIVASIRAEDCVCVSKATRKWYPWASTVIPNGVDLTRHHPGGVKAVDPTILFVGTYQRRKRGKLLVEVFEAHVRKHVPGAELWMVCEDAPSTPGVRVFGRVTDAELADLYRQAWVFCLPSTYEGFGVPYVEAMASGLPVVATHNAGAREVLGNGEFGLLVRDDELGATLVRLLKNAPEREQMATKGLDHARTFDWRIVTEAYVRRYERIASGRAGQRTGGRA